MSTTSERLRSLVEGLFIATKDGRLKWSSVPNSFNYFAVVAGNKVEIGSETNENGGEDVRLTVYNSAGDEVDSFSDTYFGATKPKNVAFNTYYTVMAVLLEDARRSATGADKVVEDILSQLGTPKVDEELDDDVPF